MKRIQHGLPILVFSLFLQAQTNAQPPGQSDRQSGGAPQQRQNSNATSQSSGRQSSFGRNVQSGRSGLTGRSGQTGQRQIGTGDRRVGTRGLMNSGSQLPRNSSQQGRGVDPRDEFTRNAMRFDLNNDQQLAAHELRNLFILLTSQQQQQTAYTNTTPLSQRLGNPRGNYYSTGNVRYSSGNTGGGVPQGLAIRQAIFIFLQLVMQFDRNRDGLLSQAELNQFAEALLNNNLSLLGAAANRSGRSGNSYSVANVNPQYGSRGYSRNSQPTSVLQQQQQQQALLLRLGQNGGRGQTSRSRSYDRNQRGGSGSGNRSGSSGTSGRSAQSGRTSGSAASNARSSGSQRSSGRR